MSDEESWRSSRSAVATTRRRGVSMLQGFGRGWTKCWVRHGAGEDGSGVCAGLGTSVSLTVAVKTKSYDATYRICEFINASHTPDITLIGNNSGGTHTCLTDLFPGLPERASTHTHTRLTALCPGLPVWAGSTRKVKPIWILLKQETLSGSGISWAVCKSAPRSRPITTPVLLQAGCPSCRQQTASKHWREDTCPNYYLGLSI